MDNTNLQDYITKLKPSKIEFKIIRVDEYNTRKFYIKFLKQVDRLFRKKKQVWGTLCEKSGESYVTWETVWFDTKELAESYIDKHTTIPRESEVLHFVRDVK
jgi:hypothetical protein